METRAHHILIGAFAILAFLLFGEKLDALSILGMIGCAAGVLLVNWKRAT